MRLHGAIVSALLSERLHELGLRLHRVECDGNCQFRALAYMLGMGAVEPMVLRQMIVAYIANNRQRFEGFIEGEVTFEAYCERMQGSGERADDIMWGDALTLRAAADVFRVHIVLVRSTGEQATTTITSQTSPNGRIVYLAFFPEVHYDATEPISQIASTDVGHVGASSKKLFRCMSNWMEWNLERPSGKRLKISPERNVIGNSLWTGRLDLTEVTLFSDAVRVVGFFMIMWRAIGHVMVQGTHEAEDLPLLSEHELLDRLRKLYQISSETSVKFASDCTIRVRCGIVEVGPKTDGVWFRVGEDDMCHESARAILALTRSARLSLWGDISLNLVSRPVVDNGSLWHSVRESLAMLASAPFITAAVLLSINKVFISKTANGEVISPITVAGRFLRMREIVMIVTTLLTSELCMASMFYTLVGGSSPALASGWRFSLAIASLTYNFGSLIPNSAFGAKALGLAVGESLPRVGWVFPLLANSRVGFDIIDVYTAASVVAAYPGVPVFGFKLALMTMLMLHTMLVVYVSLKVCSINKVVAARLRVERGASINQATRLPEVAFKAMSVRWRTALKTAVCIGDNAAILLGQGDHCPVESNHTYLRTADNIYQKMLPLHLPGFVSGISGKADADELKTCLELAAWSEGIVRPAEWYAKSINFKDILGNVANGFTLFFGPSSVSPSDLYGVAAGATSQDRRIYYLRKVDSAIVISKRCSVIVRDASGEATGGVVSLLECLLGLKADLLRTEMEVISNRTYDLCYMLMVGGFLIGEPTRFHISGVTRDNCLNPVRHLSGQAIEATVVICTDDAVRLEQRRYGQLTKTCCATIRRFDKVKEKEGL